jgi:signal transduction histidine kinase
MAAEHSAPPSPSLARSPRTSLSRRQVERLVSRSTAVFSVLFFAQTFPVAFEQVLHRHEQLQWTRLIALLFLLSLVFICVAAIAQRWVRVAATSFALLYLLALITWPLANRIPLEPSDGAHWIYYLLTVATSLAALAMPLRLAVPYLVAAPTLYAISSMRTSLVGTSPQQAILEAIYSLILGGAILVIIAMLRQAATAVDRAQAHAFESYAEAVRQHAIEKERVQVDSIVHDSVLTTLLSAARADTAEARELAATMARNAIGHLHQAALTGPAGGETVTLTALARQVATAAEAVGVPFTVRARDLPVQEIPAVAAEALHSAAAQAMVNSAQHAGASASRWVTIRPLAPAGAVVEVVDTGRGFVTKDVSKERLGLRVSIYERLEKAGGRAEITASPGKGTAVTLRWPAGGA